MPTTTTTTTAVAAPALKHLAFVYGTLKRGESNYPYWLADPRHARFVGAAETVERYPFFVNLSPDSSSPCVLELPGHSEGCQHVRGELFLISDTMLAWLDVLEAVSIGIYEAVPTLVRALEPPHAAPTGEPLDDLLAPHLAGADGSGSGSGSGGDAGLPTLRALLYFRRAAYPPDWEASQLCSPLLASFSATECLQRFRGRFCRGAPGHLWVGDKLGAALAALPEEYRPSPAQCRYGAPLRPPPLVLFLIDGVGDNTLPELGGRTPLEVVAGVAAREGRPGAPPATPETLTEEELAAFVSPGINAVAAAGVNGLLDPYLAGKACGSDTAHLGLLGYDPVIYYRGRGAYEALGAGLPLAPADVAFKSNFATYEWREEGGAAAGAGRRKVVVRRRCDRDFTAEGPVLCAALDGLQLTHDAEGAPLPRRHTVRVHYATEHRCGVAIHTDEEDEQGQTGGEGTGGGDPLALTDAITGTDPLQDGRELIVCAPAAGHEDDPRALYTSRVVEAASAALTAALEAHPINRDRAAAGKPPANVILLRGAAQVGWVPSFNALHGRHAYAVAPTCIIKGLAACCGMDTDNPDIATSLAGAPADDPRAGAGIERLLGATGDVHSAVRRKVRIALAALGLDGPAARAAVPLPGPAEEAAVAALSEGQARPHDFVLLHVKGVDDAGHEAAARDKLRLLRECGEALGALHALLSAGAVLAVAADHSTPLRLGDHSSEPVPLAVCVVGGERDGAGAVEEWWRAQGLAPPPRDEVEVYTEVAAAGEGGGAAPALGRVRGETLVPLMKRMQAYYHY